MENDSKIQLIGKHDLFAIGKPDIMKNAYCNLITRPIYDFRKTNHIFKDNLISYDSILNKKQIQVIKDFVNGHMLQKLNYTNRYMHIVMNLI